MSSYSLGYTFLLALYEIILQLLTLLPFFWLICYCCLWLVFNAVAQLRISDYKFIISWSDVESLSSVMGQGGGRLLYIYIWHFWIENEINPNQSLLLSTIHFWIQSEVAGNTSVTQDRFHQADWQHKFLITEHNPLNQPGNQIIRAAQSYNSETLSGIWYM